jgi:glycosyltransferase involved in cell wall biosynthesis
MASGCAEAVCRPGFLQVAELPRWYAHAGAFILSSLSEPWGLVANEAAASGLPLLVSRRAGCAATLVPDPPGTTGVHLDPSDIDDLAGSLAHIASLSPERLAEMGRRAAEVVSHWGPARFADGVLDAIERALSVRRRSLHPARVRNEVTR